MVTLGDILRILSAPLGSKKLDWGPYQMAKKDFDDKRVEEDQALRADCMDSDLTQCLQIPTSWVGYC